MGSNNHTNRDLDGQDSMSECGKTMIWRDAEQSLEPQDREKEWSTEDGSRLEDEIITSWWNQRME